jgi:hypothetical protein
MSDYRIKLKNISSLDKNIKIVFLSSEFNRSYTKELENINEKLLKDN